MRAARTYLNRVIIMQREATRPRSPTVCVYSSETNNIIPKKLHYNTVWVISIPFGCIFGMSFEGLPVALVIIIIIIIRLYSTEMVNMTKKRDSKYTDMC